MGRVSRLVRYCKTSGRAFDGNRKLDGFIRAPGEPASHDGALKVGQDKNGPDRIVASWSAFGRPIPVRAASDFSCERFVGSALVVKHYGTRRDTIDVLSVAACSQGGKLAVIDNPS